MFSFKAWWIPYWDGLIILLALVNCLMVPLETAIDLEYTNYFMYDIMNVVFDLLFFADILISFNTTYEENNEEISDRV
jgi:hypothetical protein